MKIVTWQQPPPELKLINDQVHIWQASFEFTADRIHSFKAWLSKEEMERANRFLFQKDHDLFIVSHGILRAILGRYLKTSPQRIVFAFNRYGKPFLAAPEGVPLHFNLSHSHQQGLYAFSRNLEVGIDLEFIKPKPHAAQIIARFFSETEKREFQNLPSRLKTNAFFKGWTEKEAYLKAHGSGLSIPLHKFSVTLNPHKPAMLLQIDPDIIDGKPWLLKEIPLGENYAAAVAVAGGKVDFSYWTWTAPKLES